MEFLDNPKTSAEKVAKIILTQAKIEKLLLDIIITLVRQDDTGENASIFERELGLTYDKKLKILKLLTNNADNNELFESLSKMGNLRNKVAHRDLMGELATKEFENSFRACTEIRKLLGKKKTNKNADIEHIYDKYISSEERVKDFFDADTKEQIKYLRRGKICPES